MKRALIIIMVLFSFNAARAQKIYKHGVFWGRLVFADRISNKLKWELHLQKRTQTSGSNSDMFAAPHVFSAWSWFSYELTENTRVSLSPVAYFISHPFYNSPDEVREKGVREFRTSVRIENEQKARWFNYSNRYSMEHRSRDLENNGVYQSNWRGRYMVKIEKPLKNILSEDKPLSVYISNEILIQFGHAVRNNPNIFDQNRINAGLAYEIFKNIKLNASYLNIVQQRSSGNELDYADTLWLTLTFDNLFTQFKKQAKKPVL